MKPQPHSWMPYLYRYKADNDNYKMWIRDNQKIYQIETGEYVVADDSGWREGVYATFEEAEKAFGNDNVE